MNKVKIIYEIFNEIFVYGLTETKHQRNKTR